MGRLGARVLGLGGLLALGVGVPGAGAVGTDCDSEPATFTILAAPEERNRIFVGVDPDPGVTYMQDNGVNGEGDPIDASAGCLGSDLALSANLRDRADTIKLEGFAGAEAPFPDSNGVFVRGGPGADRVFGHDGRDILLGGDGKNLVRGLGGDDLVRGGLGYDELGGGAGADVLLGAEGSDVIHALDRSKDRIRCGRGRFDNAWVDHRDVTRGCETIYFPR